MSAHIMARKHRAQKGVSTGKDFSTYGVKRIHYYTGASGVTKTAKCVESIGTTPLLPAKTTYGLLSNRIHFPTQLCEDGTCAKYNWVKSFNPEEHAQSNYIHKIKVAAACNNDLVYDSGTVNCNTDCKETYMIGGKRMSNSYYHKNASSGALDSSEYTSINVYQNKCLPTPPCKAPFPFIINQKGCNVFFKTPEEAIAAGYLPKNWMNCDTDVAFKSYS